ncbi:MAG: rhodanese-like domain-containing protein [Alphaproteobacteria bacterium]|nr:rhodanese-like domain-containing protein [Alphaproteobacteria bacterium]
MTRSVKELVDAASTDIETLSVEEAMALHGKDTHIFVDIRDVRELWREGAIPGAVHAPRGMLEFWFDPQCPYHRDVFAQAGKTYLLFCAGGLRSALAAKALQDMGFTAIAHIGGGFGGWKEAGGPVESKEPPPVREKI